MACRHLRTTPYVRPIGVDQAAAPGVTVEPQSPVGEYDILIPSAEERAGLETWLARAGHRPPEGVIPILDHDIVRGRPCFVPRRHPRHDAEHVPDDPRVRVSAERENVQGREFLRHPCRGGAPRRAAFSAWPSAELRARRAKSGRSTPDPEGLGGT